MDLTKYALTAEQLSEAKSLLGYQPYRLTDSIITGVGHSWMHAAAPETLHRPQFVFDEETTDHRTWNRALNATCRLERSYDAFLDSIATAVPGGSYLDVACNSGYFPVGAHLRGMRPAFGIDAGDFAPQFQFLNRITGSHAEFALGKYDSREHSLQLPSTLPERFDAVSCVAFMFHVPDPLHLLRSIAGVARHVVFLWSAFLRNDEYLIRYPEPNQFGGEAFPLGFDAGTAVSDALLIKSMSLCGFPKHRELTPDPDCWPSEWDNPLMKRYQPLRAFLFMRA